MDSNAALQPEAAPITACTICRDVQNFDLLIEDMESELGESWGDLSFDDALPFFAQPEASALEFVAIAIDNALIIDRVTVLNRLVVQEKDELRHAYDHISELANQDHLTGVSNRRMFHQFVAASLGQRRENLEPLAIVFIDLDQFKPINDTHGHQAGDVVLKEVASRLHGVTRSDDLVARVGGDEFVVVLTVGPSAEVVTSIAEKLKEEVARPISMSGVPGSTVDSVVVSASTGYALFPDHGTTYDELVSYADSQMYRAKRTQE